VTASFYGLNQIWSLTEFFKGP